MLKVTLEIHEIDKDISIFELGNVDITVKDKTISSRHKTPDQSFMLFSSLADLLDGIYELYEDKRKSYIFIGDDSSFKIIFTMLPNENIQLQSDKLILEINAKIFIKELILKCENLLMKYSDRIIDDNYGIIKDIHNSLQRWTKLLKNQ